jgi:hypothetical protein
VIKNNLIKLLLYFCGTVLCASMGELGNILKCTAVRHDARSCRNDTEITCSPPLITYCTCFLLWSKVKGHTYGCENLRFSSTEYIYTSTKVSDYLWSRRSAQTSLHVGVATSQKIVQPRPERGLRQRCLSPG